MREPDQAPPVSAKPAKLNRAQRRQAKREGGGVKKIAAALRPHPGTTHDVLPRLFIISLAHEHARRWAHDHGYGARFAHVSGEDAMRGLRGMHYIVLDGADRRDDFRHLMTRAEVQGWKRLNATDLEGENGRRRQEIMALAAALAPKAGAILADERPIYREAMKHGHAHAEAFCLMRYRCIERGQTIRVTTPDGRHAFHQGGCGHFEIIWNSRDGVTPFGTTCPSCGGHRLQHVDFGADTYAPDHQLHRGQRFWRDATLEEWIKVYLARIEALPEYEGEDMKVKLHNTKVYAQQALERGEPWLDVKVPL